MGVSRDHQDELPTEPEGETERPAGPPRTERFTVSAGRFNAGAIQQGIERAATLYGLRTWIKTGDGLLRRDLDVTVHGDPAGIADLVTYIESLRAGSADAGGPF